MYMSTAISYFVAAILAFAVWRLKVSYTAQCCKQSACSRRDSSTDRHSTTYPASFRRIDMIRQITMSESDLALKPAAAPSNARQGLRASIHYPRVWPCAKAHSRSPRLDGQQLFQYHTHAKTGVSLRQFDFRPTQTAAIDIGGHLPLGVGRRRQLA